MFRGLEFRAASLEFRFWGSGVRGLRVWRLLSLGFGVQGLGAWGLVFMPCSWSSLEVFKRFCRGCTKATRAVSLQNLASLQKIKLSRFLSIKNLNIISKYL